MSSRPSVSQTYRSKDDISVDTFITPRLGHDKNEWSGWLRKSVDWIEGKPFKEEFRLVLHYLIILERYHGFLPETPSKSVSTVRDIAFAFY